MLLPGEAAEVGPFAAPLPRAGAGELLTATVIYNCGAPWGLAPIVKTVALK